MYGGTSSLLVYWGPVVRWYVMDQWSDGIWVSSGHMVYGGSVVKWFARVVVSWCMGDQWSVGVWGTSG